MADIDVSIYYNEDRIEAMSRILHSQGLDLKTAIQEQMDALYVKLVPEQERSEIDAKIALEHAQRMKELEASRSSQLYICMMHRMIITSSQNCTPASCRAPDCTGW